MREIQAEKKLIPFSIKVVILSESEKSSIINRNKNIPRKILYDLFLLHLTYSFKSRYRIDINTLSVF